ncbi:hypothetical protein [Curtobacterium sp. MCBD17_040]|uniref:hypothetical protein n=1 Tax=Curtobacterium sp. MCBD17_040 TaxID=2175674 RepID=UPI0015E8DACD|nr:hypothetical protein [Curtobacterium sp. MCBD17_040]WIB64047.1 hypothetical protein DEI94_02295 [Curtobacterium sp. MCBD17_040]
MNQHVRVALKVLDSEGAQPTEALALALALAVLRYASSASDTITGAFHGMFSRFAKAL